MLNIIEEFEKIYLRNFGKLIDDCKSFAKGVQGTEYEFLLDNINPSIFNPSDIEIEQIYAVIDKLLNAPSSGRLMDKTDYTGFKNLDIMFFNPLNDVIDSLSFEDQKHINQLRQNRFYEFLNFFIDNKKIEIDNQNFFNKNYFGDGTNNNFWNDGGPKYSASTVSNFIREVMTNTFQPDYNFDKLNSTSLKTIFKKKVNEKFYLGLQFDITPHRFKYNLHNEMHFPNQIDLFFTKSEEKMSPRNTIFLGKYSNPCFYFYNLNVFHAVSRNIVLKNKQFKFSETSLNPVKSLDWSNNSKETIENNKSIFIDWDNKVKYYAHAYFSLLKFSSQPYEVYLIDCIRKMG